jgi:uncharacterized protein
MNKIKEDIYIINSNKIENDLIIIILTDIHFSYNFSLKKVSTIINYLKETKPDYILIPGDLVDSPKYLEEDNIKSDLRYFLKQIGEIAPVCISLGNHDIAFEVTKPIYRVNYCFNELFYNSLNNIPNVSFLNNKDKEFLNINISALSLSFNYYFKNNKCFEDINNLINDYHNSNLNPKSNKFNIMLCHSPEYILDNKMINNLNSYDLIISGHMHSGIIKFHNNKGLINPQKQFFQPNCSGLIKKSNTTLIVGRQVTTFSSVAPKIFQLTNIFFPIYVSKIIIKK